MLWLLLEIFKELSLKAPQVIFIDEGDVFDEIIQFIMRIKKEWGIDLVVLKNRDISERIKKIGDVVYINQLNERNRAEIRRLGYSRDTFKFDPESYIGNHLMKTVPMNLYLEESGISALFTGIRWDEQHARVQEVYFSRRKEPEHIRVHPILHFTERDVWNNIFLQGLPFCSLYWKGYRSLGTRSSTLRMSDIPAWEQDLEKTTERSGRGQNKEEIMEQLRSLGYM
jgi:phosphoadenosine phosphosulfate reductase